MNTRHQRIARDRPADWKLPPGVAPGTWDYAHSDWIASDYDQFLANTPLAKNDLQWLVRILPPATSPGQLVADLGCGTARSAPPLQTLGYRLLGIDLSQDMLAQALRVGRDWSPETSPLLLRANLVSLDCLAAGSVDHAICLFSTLGMVRGRKNRRRVLTHVSRILRPGGKFLLHVHNRWAPLRDPGGWRHLWSSWRRSRRDKQADFGDRVYAYRGLPNMFLHSYGRLELTRDLKAAGLQVDQLKPLAVTGEGLLKNGWFAGGLRAGGFLAIASKV